MNFFRGAKKAGENPGLPRPDPLSVWPRSARRAFSVKRRHGLSFTPEASRPFPYSFSGRNCPRYPPPDAALSFFPRRAPLCPLSLVRGGASLSLSCRVCNCRFSPAGRCSARFPLPGTGPVRLSRRWTAQALPCARKESAPLPCSPLLPGAETGLHPGKNKKPGHPRRGGRTGVFRCQAMKLR